MELKRAFGALLVDLEELRRPIDELIKLTGDYGPQKGAVHLIAKLYDHLVELGALCEETSEAAKRALKAADQAVDLDAARWALAACQESLGKLVKKSWQDVISFDQIEDLIALGRERGSQWSKWTRAYQSWSKDFTECLLRVSNEAAPLCWAELTDRLAMSSVSVRATNIGQQITLSEANERASAGIT